MSHGLLDIIELKFTSSLLQRIVWLNMGKILSLDGARVVEETQKETSRLVGTQKHATELLSKRLIDLLVSPQMLNIKSSC